MRPALSTRRAPAAEPGTRPGRAGSGQRVLRLGRAVALPVHPRSLLVAAALLALLVAAAAATLTLGRLGISPAAARPPRPSSWTACAAPA
jgi:iron complex transport system permease protein